VNRSVRIILGLVAIALVVVVGVLWMLDQNGRWEERDRLRESERISQIREDPCLNVRDGLAVDVVDRALGPGRRFRAKGQDLIVWTGTTAGKTWAITALVKDGNLSDQSWVRGGPASQEYAMGQRGWTLEEDLAWKESQALAEIPGDDQDSLVALVKKLGGEVGSDNKDPKKPIIEVKFGIPFYYEINSGIPFHDASRQFPRPLVRGPALARLKGLKHLQTLRLGGSAVTDDALGYVKELTSLTTLELTLTQITDAGLKHLEALANLKRLQLDGTSVGDMGLAHLRALAHLEWLDLVDTKVTDAGLEHLKGLTKLKFLGLKGTRVTNEGVKKLKVALPRPELMISH
jgi:hypothetical protein